MFYEEIRKVINDNKLIKNFINIDKIDYCKFGVDKIIAI